MVQKNGRNNIAAAMLRGERSCTMCETTRGREESNARKEDQMEDYDYQTATEEQMRRFREYNCIVELPPEVYEYLDEHPGALSGVSWEKGG
ncbi:MAG: hypothetical protein G01um101429_682 [Parcubacteria group bacterium Gr01-1014_29]|nr:MAG: hypothetical protein G01um101429_682 [Parcubacteria group bacterium Gr01-1014_29]